MYKFGKIFFVVMMSVCINALFYPAVLIAMEQKSDTQLTKKGCPCHACIKTGIAGKQHPYTDQENFLAHVSLALPLIFPAVLQRLVLEYVLDEHDAWITLEGPIVGDLALPERKYGALDRCTHVLRFMDILGEVILAERLMDEEVRFHADGMNVLAKFFKNPQEKPCALYSLCERYKISAKKYDTDGYVCVESSYLLNTFARLPGCIEHIKKAQQKESMCCIVL